MHNVEGVRNLDHSFARYSWFFKLPSSNTQYKLSRSRVLRVRFKDVGGNCPPRTPMGPEPLVRAVRERREHKEQIVVSTRAVYPGSGRDGRVKPYSCLDCIECGSSGA